MLIKVKDSPKPARTNAKTRSKLPCERFLGTDRGKKIHDMG